MIKYKYSANDASLMTPFLYRFFLVPMLKIVPYQIPANFITIISNSCVLVSFFIAWHGYHRGDFFLYSLIPFLCFAYIVGDCFDGIQARRTGTSSPLGEYFDHFLDSFVTGLLTGTLLLSLRSRHWLILIFPYQALYLGQIGAFWERAKTGTISFAKVSTSEGVMTIAIGAFLASCAFMRPFVACYVIFGLSLLDFVLLTCFFFAGVAGIKAFLVVKIFSFPLILHVFFSSFITFLCVYFGYSIFFITIITTFYNAFFISPILSSISTGTPEAYPDSFIPISFLFCYFYPDSCFLISVLQLAYLSMRVLIRFLIFLHKNRQYWVWCNKECKDMNLLAE